jgi:hypothetical protein
MTGMAMQQVTSELKDCGYYPLWAEGTPFFPCTGGVRPISRKVERHLSMKPEAHTYKEEKCG